MDPFADRPHRVSLEEVAQAVGVSKATACRALLGRSRVSEETRAKVKAAAERLGYRPDPALSALTKHRWAIGGANRASYQVAIIHVRGSDAGFTLSRINTNPATAAVRQRCEELGFMLSEWVLEEQYSPAHLGRMLYSRGVDGIIIDIQGPVTDWDFPWHHFTTVTLGHDQDTHQTHSIVPDWFRSITIAVTKAREAGKKRIGFASFNRRNPEIDDLLNASIMRNRAKLEAELGPQPTVFHYPSVEQHISQCFKPEGQHFRTWLKTEKPDVIIDTNRIAYWWLRDLGYHPPKKIGYITAVGQPSTAEPDELSSVSLRREQQGKSAVELLFNLLQLNLRGLPTIPLRMIVSSGWVEGTTLR